MNQQQQLYEYMRRVHAQQQQQQQQQSSAVPGMVAQPGPVSPAMALQLLSRQQQMYTQQAAAFMPHTMPGMMPGAARMMPYPMGAAGMPRPGMMPFGMPPFMARQGTQQPQDSTASEIEIAMAVIEIKLGTDRLTSLKILQQVAKRQVKANRGDKMITFTVGTPPTPANPQSVCGYVALCKATGRIYVCSSSKDLANKFAMNVNNLARNRLKQLPHHRAFEMSSRAQHSSYLTAAHANTSAKGIYRVVNLVAVARFPDVVDVVKLAAAKEKILEQENCVRVHFDPSEVSSGTSVAVTIVHEVPPPVPASQPEQPASVPQSPGGDSGTPSSKRPRPEDDGLDEPELHVLMSPMNKRPRVDSSASRLSDGLGTEEPPRPPVEPRRPEIYTLIFPSGQCDAYTPAVYIKGSVSIFVVIHGGTSGSIEFEEVIKKHWRDRIRPLLVQYRFKPTPTAPSSEGKCSSPET